MTTPHDSRDLEAQTEAQGRRFVRENDDGNDQTRETRRKVDSEAAQYGDSSAMYWKLYTSEAEINDQKLVKTLTGDTDSVLILYGIFSSIIASFLIQTSQALQPNNSQETVCLLSQLVSQGNSTQQSSPSCPAPYPGAPSEAAILSNILLLISLFLAMISVLACALIHQWCSDFVTFAYPRAAPHKRGRVRTYLFHGLNRFYMTRLVNGVHVLLHISVFLFFFGISYYFHDLYPRVGMISWYCVIASAGAYGALSIFPLIIGNCPYQTALTPPLRFSGMLLLFFGRTIWRWLWIGRKGSLPRREDFDTTRFLSEEADQAAYLDSYAMKWLVTDNDLSDTNMDAFLEGLPGYINSHFTAINDLPEVLTAPYILQRIKKHLLMCVTAIDLSEEARVKRVSACVDSLRVILDLSHWKNARRLENPPDEESPREYMQNIIDNFNTLCEEPGKMWELAFCVRALAFQGFLTRSLEPLSGTSKFPDHFIPLHTFFFSWVDMLQVQRPATLPLPAESLSPDEDRMWRADAPLINLTLLARAILSHDDVDPSNLSMCWKTLDILRSELRINRVDVSDSSLALFDAVHQETRRRVGAEEPGLSVVPLLEILDAVAGGRRLSVVFRDRPKYYGKADLVFGKDHLRNPDLFRAFANCLPVFVSQNPEESMAFMEGLVRYDYLWTSLQVHLLNVLRPNGFIPATLRAFDTCCTVIDAAFVALENSEIVDWRAPDFGSMANYFELFVTDCFQGMFPERVIGFRVGLIKARFCRAILAQFLAEFNGEGTVVFRSNWDVASLARVFYSLGVGDDADVEFWKSFVDGGPIGPELMAKTYTTLDTAARDGPLLNFCKLGHLGMMAVPFRGSGIRETDFKKLLDLQQKMLEDSRLPLTLASTPVWEDLGRLRDEVVDICERSSDEDEAIMRALLANIDAIYSHRPSSTQEDLSSDYVHAQASGMSAVVQPDPSSREPMPGNYFGGTAAAPFDGFRGEFANVYRTPYPLFPIQIGPDGAATRPFSASFLPTPFPISESTHLASSSSSPSNPRLVPPMRHNSRALVYYPPLRTHDSDLLPSRLSR